MHFSTSFIIIHPSLIKEDTYIALETSIELFSKAWHKVVTENAFCQNKEAVWLGTTSVYNCVPLYLPCITLPALRSSYFLLFEKLQPQCVRTLAVICMAVVHAARLQPAPESPASISSLMAWDPLRQRACVYSTISVWAPSGNPSAAVFKAK